MALRKLRVTIETNDGYFDSNGATDDNKITTDNEITNTWLLPYDPEKWDWIESGCHNDDLIKLKKEDKSFTIRWLATSEYSSVGDRGFISKIGNQKPNGIVASGYIVSEEYTAANDTSYEFYTYINIEITGFIDSTSPLFITTDSIKNEFPKYHRSNYSAELPTDVAEWLIKKWDNSYKLHNNSNEPVIWKISHGTPQTSGISKELRKALESRKAVIVNQYTPASIGQKISQGDSFMKQIKQGDFFFLCYAGEIVLFGRFINNKVYANPEKLIEWDGDDWQERKYQLIALSKDHNKYTGIKKIWTSNNNST